MHTKFHTDLFRHSKVVKGVTQIHRQHGDLIRLLSLFKEGKSTKNNIFHRKKIKPF
jgi:hypothetical protein